MENKPPYKINQFYLTQNRDGYWCRTWYDPQTQQRKSASLRTRDLQKAQTELTEWFVKNHTPILDDDLELSRCFIEYWEQHAQYLKRKKVEQDNIVFWLEYFPEKLVREIRPPDQRAFLKHLVDKGYSKTYITGIFKTGVSAINFAWKNDMLGKPLPVLSPAVELKKYTFEKKMAYRALEIEEIATLIDHATVDRLIRFVLIMIGCACRPGAAMELEGAQIDVQSGTIDLLKPGQEQTNKYRPVVRLPSFIADFYHQDNLVHQGKVKIKESRQTDSIRRAWNGAKRRGKLDKQVVPYAIRHTMAKWLRQSGVQPWHTSSQMGHKRRGNEITEIYAPNDPAYLGDALRAIEEYYALLFEASEGLRNFWQRDHEQ